ncbi:hypothetical protein A142_12035 [Vibrio splendidus 12E03]|uniref:Uncharacterized protein n=1 Tax=Vibrio splendidus 12E03 TaxID=1191305 RepID=A0A1E5FBE6_VIBSP|nr:hypothetical protein A142_12035 [Vibrio splendidus 12E03]
MLKFHLSLALFGDAYPAGGNILDKIDPTASMVIQNCMGTFQGTLNSLSVVKNMKQQHPAKAGREITE